MSQKEKEKGKEERKEMMGQNGHVVCPPETSLGGKCSKCMYCGYCERLSQKINLQIPVWRVVQS